MRALLRTAALGLLTCALTLPANTEAQSALPASLPAADLLRLEHTTLTMDDLNRFLLTANDIAALAAKSPRIAAIVNAEPRNLQTTVHRVESEPDLLAAVTHHGFTPDTFAVTEYALLQTVIVFASGATPKTIAAAHVNPANIALFQQHGPEIMALYSKLQQ